MVIGQLVRRYADNFDVALRKIGLATSDLTEFGCAYRGEIGGVGEQDGLITIELDWPMLAHSSRRTQELPIHSWNLIGPSVV